MLQRPFIWQTLSDTTSQTASQQHQNINSFVCLLVWMLFCSFVCLFGCSLLSRRLAAAILELIKIRNRVFILHPDCENKIVRIRITYRVDIGL